MMNMPLPCMPKPSADGVCTLRVTCSQFLMGRHLSLSGSCCASGRASCGCQKVQEATCLPKLVDLSSNGNQAE